MPKLTIEQMGELFELREGKYKPVSWDNLSMIYGVSTTTLKRYYRQAQLYGFYLWTDYRNDHDMD